MGLTSVPCGTRISLLDLLTCAASYSTCQLPQSLAKLAVRAFDVDSHENSFMTANSVIRHFKEPELITQRKKKFNELLTKFEKIPPIGKPGIIEETLTCS